MAAMTTVPAAIDAVVDMFTAALATPYPAVPVYDGPPPMTDLPRSFVCVGYSEEEDEFAIVGDVNRYGEGVPSETYVIRCYVTTWDGDSDDLRSKRQETGAIYNVVAGTVWANRSLGGVIQPPGLAEINGFSWSMEQYEDGCAAIASFAVSVTESVLWG